MVFGEQQSFSESEEATARSQNSSRKNRSIQRINRYELGIHKPDLLTVRKLAEVLKVPMAFFYADTNDEIAELLFRYGKASEEVRLKVQAFLSCQPPQDR